MQLMTNPLPFLANQKSAESISREESSIPRNRTFSANVLVKNSLGLHARPAAMLVRAASAFPCEISLSSEDLAVSAKSIIGILTLGAGKGTEIRIEACCCRAYDAVMTLKLLFDRGFGEI